MDEELTAAQRKFLRSTARRLTPDVIVGKGGIGENVIRHIRALLSRRELIKVRLPRWGLLESAASNRAATAEEIANRAGAALVNVIGRVVVLYRPNEQLPEVERLILPRRPKQPCHQQ